MAVTRVPEEPLGFLRDCLVEGDSAQESRVRYNKQRALFASILVQLLIVAALVIFPLLSKGENIASRAIYLPTTPYSRGRIGDTTRRAIDKSRGRISRCHFCAPSSIPPTIVIRDVSPIDDPIGPAGPSIPGVPEGARIPGVLSIDSHREPPAPDTHPHVAARRKISEPIIAARLVHRVEPVYPALGRQLGREGRVELHAIISTDGSIQSLEVVTGDALFIQSALAAVREWRYQPTLLDGQPVEVDTHITVIYSLSR